MSDRNTYDIDWRLVNETYIKNQKYRRRKAVIFVLILSFVAFIVFIGYRKSNGYEYDYVIKDYYKCLNAGSEYKDIYGDLDIKDDAKESYKNDGYDNYMDYLYSMQKRDTEEMEEKYGKNFNVTYRVEKTTALTEDELKTLSENSPEKAQYTKGYIVTLKERFIGSKAVGYEENKILVFVNQDNYWRSYVCRQLAFIYDLSYDEIIDKLIHEEQ